MDSKEWIFWTRIEIWAAFVAMAGAAAGLLVAEWSAHFIWAAPLLVIAIAEVLKDTAIIERTKRKNKP